MEPQLRFCTSADGTRLAVYTLGQGPPRVYVGGGMVHFDQDLERPEGRAFIEGLAKGHQFIWFDKRGIGASERNVDEISLETAVADLTAVVETLRLEQFDLIAADEGAAISVAYAALHPEQVRRMALLAPVIYGPDVAAPEVFRTLIDLVRSNWSAARRIMAGNAFPNGPVEEQRWLSKYIRQAASSEVSARYLEFSADLDVRTAAAQVGAPTLILHRRGQRNKPVNASRGAAAMIPDAQFVALDGEVSIPYLGAPGQVLNQIIGFLEAGSMPEPASQAPATVSADTHTILFTDMEGSTTLADQHGDAAAQEVRRAHNEIVRAALQASSGSEIKHTGDGIMASFATASAALGAAIAIQRGVAAHKETNPDSPLGVYVGLNAGEPIAEEGDLFGTSINLAARICDHANAGQILAANVVRELAAGKDFLFADLGETELRGFEDPVKLWELRWENIT